MKYIPVTPPERERMLRSIGVVDTIAQDTEDYVRIAARLVRDPAWRDDVVRRIAEGRQTLFDDPRPIDAWIESLERLAGA